MKAPIFIFSLPRSGSTLLQRILMCHPEIASTAEPWFLLPLIYTMRNNGTLTEYSFANCYAAVEDFIDKLPNKKKDYYDAIRVFSFRLYENQCKSKEKYFLDKTPRYYHIIDEISQIFPQAKFIFLFRNPVQIFCSIVSTWGNKRLKKLYSSYHDLREGPNLLTQGYQKLKNVSYALQYEQLINKPEFYLKEMMSYLELDYDELMLKKFNEQHIAGRMGDPIGPNEYNKITQEPLEKWKRVVKNPVRKWYLKKYIKQLDPTDLSIAGYDKPTILNEIENLKTDKFLNLSQDIIDLGYAYLVRKCKANIFFGKSTKWARKDFLS